MTTVEQRTAIERRVIRKLIRIAYDAGWTIPFVHDGEELVKTDTHKSIMDAVFSVDESSIRFRKGESLRGSAYIVLGNDGWDCIADNSMGDLFLEEVIKPIEKYIDEKWV